MCDIRFMDFVFWEKLWWKFWTGVFRKFSARGHRNCSNILNFFNQFSRIFVKYFMFFDEFIRKYLVFNCLTRSCFVKKLSKCLGGACFLASQFSIFWNIFDILLIFYLKIWKKAKKNRKFSWKKLKKNENFRILGR